VRLTLLMLAVALGVPASVAAAPGDADVAALQVELRARGLYAGPIDGFVDPATRSAVSEFQRRSGLRVDGVPSDTLRRALGEYGRHTLGSRVLSAPSTGWDVAALQFALAWRGFPSGPIDGRFTQRTAAAVRRFQRFAGLGVDGVVGAATVAALRARPLRSPLTFSRPVPLPPSGFFGPRGDRFHTGLDFAANAGMPVAAARAGRVTYAGWHPAGWGYLVTIAHGAGVRTMYAHLSHVDVAVGQWVMAGAVVGAAGSSGNSFGPHVHFEIRVRGAAVDPLPALSA